jgi:hypothetical protein
VTAYEISVLGRVDATLLADLEELEAVPRPTVTVLRGTLAGPGELRGILSRLEDRGLELVEIRQVEPDPDADERG